MPEKHPSSCARGRSMQVIEERKKFYAREKKRNDAVVEGTLLLGERISSPCVLEGERQKRDER